MIRIIVSEQSNEPELGLNMENFLEIVSPKETLRWPIWFIQSGILIFEKLGSLIEGREKI